MKGKWKGTYWFLGKIPDSLKGRKTEFQLTIDLHKDSQISGRISDNIETGGTKGIGSFSGTVIGNKIQFVKRMPLSTSIQLDGTRIEENKPHRPIYYKGILNPETGTIKGTWRFKKGIGFVKGKLAYYPGTNGEWEMKRA